MKKQFPKGTTINAASWDTKDEVESMGLKDYNKNKGYSTDIYFKIQLPNGKVILDECSLKKDKNVNFLNSGVGSYLEWDPDLSDEYNPKIYAKKQTDRLVKFVKSQKDANKYFNDDIVKKLLSKIKSHAMNVDELMRDKGTVRSKNKILLSIASNMAKNKNKDADIFLKDHVTQSKLFRKNAIAVVSNNEKIKEGILKSIQNEFPLKAVASGEESMAIGDMSLDKFTLNKMFGTADYDKIKHKLYVNTKVDPPYIAYKASIHDKEIPIANLVVREDGTGYGGQFKFDLSMSPTFAKELEIVNKEIYGKK